MRSAVVRPDAAQLSIKQKDINANTAETGRVHPHDESMVALARRGPTDALDLNRRQR
jgi:hypothetical protein